MEARPRLAIEVLLLENYARSSSGIEAINATATSVVFRHKPDNSPQPKIASREPAQFRNVCMAQYADSTTDTGIGCGLSNFQMSPHARHGCGTMSKILRSGPLAIQLYLRRLPFALQFRCWTNLFRREALATLSPVCLLETTIPG